jgi:ABC-type multidrug transport system fused ATPase/permease subunit
MTDRGGGRAAQLDGFIRTLPDGYDTRSASAA